MGIKSLINSFVVKKVLDNLGDNFRLSGKKRGRPHRSKEV